MRMQLTTAAPLDARLIARICAGVEKRAGIGPAQWQVEVDPALVGGFVARIGEQVFDMSVRTQLKAFADSLLA